MSGKKRRRDAPDAPQAVLAHSVPGRIRLKFPDFRGEAEQLERLCEACVKLPGVRQAEGRTATGSLILSVEGETRALIEAATTANIFIIVEEPAVTAPIPAIEARVWEDRINEFLSSLVGPVGTVQNLSALAFLLMSLRQAASGRIMPPAASALMVAISLLLGSNNFPRDVPHSDDGE